MQGILSLSQNPVSFGKGYGESGLKPIFSAKSKVAFPKTEVLGKPLLSFFSGSCPETSVSGQL
jgi:hypothetical protein